MTITASTRRVLIPAAGFGKRIGQPPAKELLPDPASGKPLIEYGLEIALNCAALPLVISRENKTALNSYFSGRKEALLLISDSKEWTDTLQQSQRSWGETNIVLLPDTRFSPVDAVEQMFALLEAGNKTVFATFRAEDYQTWGVIGQDLKEQWSICEKPIDVSVHKNCQAWGLLGFRAEAGARLLAQIAESGESRSWVALSQPPALIALEHFEDLTRG